MHFLIYTSSASHLMSEDVLVELLQQSRIRNNQDDITGMRLCKDGSFMQILEGPKAEIFRTYDRIQKDTRHKDIFFLRDADLKDRNFDEWSMGFRSLNAQHLERVSGFSHLSSETFSSPKYTGNPHIALRVLKRFHQETR